jgi:hypothetical protein
MSMWALKQLPVIAQRVLAQEQARENPDPHRVEWARSILAIEAAKQNAAAAREKLEAQP